MQLMKWGLKPYCRKPIACLVALIMLLSIVGLGNPGSALASDPADHLEVWLVDPDSPTNKIELVNYTIAELGQMNLDQQGYSSVDKLPAPVFSAGKGIDLNDFLTNHKFDMNTVTKFKFRSTDMMSYPEAAGSVIDAGVLLDSERYYFPKIEECWEEYWDYDNEDFSVGSEVYTRAEAEAVSPMLAIESFQSRAIVSDSGDPVYTKPQFDKIDGLNTLRLFYGQKDPGENITGNFKKWIYKMEVTGKLLPIYLTPDKDKNSIGNPIEIAFEDNIAWRNGITAVSVNDNPLTADTQYTVEPGKIIINRDAFSTAGTYTVKVTSGFQDSTVQQEITEPGAELLTPPDLTADSSDNTVGNPIDITFIEDESWRTAITEVKVGETILGESQYDNTKASKIIIDANVFETADTYTIIIKATGFTDVSLTQEVNEAAEPPIDFTYTISEEGKATITGYTGTSSDVVIPSTIKDNGAEYPVTAITGNNKAAENTSVTSVIFAEPCNVTSIGDHAFYNYKALESINIPKSVLNIGMCAFRNCTALTSLKIPNNVTSIERGPFLGSGLTSLELPDNYTSISDYLYYGCGELTSIEIPNCITGIGANAFGNCSKLSSVTFAEPCKVTSIGDSAFSRCTDLTFIEIPDSVTSIGKSPFKGSGITSVTLPASMTTIPDEFYSGLKLTSIEIPSSITGIGDGAFKDISTLSSVTFAEPCSVKSIGESAFMNCTALTSIEIPDAVTEIKLSAFEKAGLSSITVHGHIRSIGDRAFCGCSSLETLIFAKPSRLTSIGEHAFNSCSKLNNITLPDSLNSIGKYAFSSCTALTSIEIPSGITCLPDRVFNSCSSLSKVTLPDGLESIGSKTFHYTVLASIEIPGNVKSIGSDAFTQDRWNNKLKSAYFFGPRPSGVSFPNKPWNFKLYYHVKNADSWASFTGYNKVKFCKLTLDLQDSSVPKSSYAVVNDKGNISISEPTREFYTFDAWYKEASCINHFSPFTEKVTDDLTLYAKWIPTSDGRAITFSIDGKIYKTVTVAPNSTIDAPEDPTKAGYTFDTWYKDENCTTAAVFPYMVTENATFYGKWIANDSVVVTFMSDGEIYTTQSALVGTAIEAPDAVKKGYTLDGWYADEGCTTEVAFPYNVGKDITLYAKWIINHKVTLMSDGKIYSTVESASGSKIPAPDAVKEGCTLDGWFFDEECTNKVAFPYTVEKDLTMYAKWILNYKITLMSDETEYKVLELPSGLILEAPDIVKDGYKFEGWFFDEGCKNKVSFPYTVGKDITMYAKWTVIDYSITIDDSISNGKVMADKTKANIGDTITLIVTPDLGKRLNVSSLKYTIDSKKYTVIDGNSFTMPAGNVTVTAAFVAESANADAWDGSIDTSWYNAEDTNFEISTSAELAGLAAIVNGTANGIAKDEFKEKTVVLMADVDLGGVQNQDGTWNESSIEWISIGGGLKDSVFRGTFDGGGHVASNIYIEKQTCDYLTDEAEKRGLFGTSSGTLKNVGVTGYVAGTRSIGGLVGKNFTRIENCFNGATVIGTQSKGVGGITGANWGRYAEIVNCYNTGSVLTDYSTGLAGGLAGDNEHVVANCYNIGQISGTKSTNVGGIVGNIKNSYEVSVTDCYHDSALNEKGIGYIDRYIGSYTVNNVVGKAAYEMKTVDFVALLNGESGSAFVQDTGNINNGYPILSWQAAPLPQTRNITSVAGINDITVPNGTAREAITLPSQVSVTLDDDSTIQLDVNWTCDTYDGNTAGEYTFTGILTLPANVKNTEDYTASVKVIVGEAVSVTLDRIEISKPAAKLVYTVGDTLDITGLQVTGYYSDGSSKIEAISTANISGFDSSKAVESQILTITVNDKTITYTVSINNTQAVTARDGGTIPITNVPLTITVPDDVKDAEITVTPNQALPLVEVKSVTMDMTIPQGTKVNGSDSIKLPEVLDSDSVKDKIPAARNVDLVVKVGSDSGTVEFTKPVRLVLRGYGPKSAGFIDNSGNFKEIEKLASLTGLTSDADADAVDLALSNAGVVEGAVTSGNDLIIWTMHFTEFIAYTPITSSGRSSSSSRGTSFVGETVKSSGGTVSKYGVTINIPADAFGETIKVKVEKVSNTSKLSFAKGTKLVSEVIEITKNESGYFKKDVTITIPFSNAKIDQDKYDVSIFYLNEKTDKWIELDDVEVDFSEAEVSGEVDHFTQFAVLAVEKEDAAEEETEDKPDETQVEKPVVLSDIAGHWAEANIIKLVNAGAIGGYPDGTFKPDNTITRAEFASILVKAFKLEPKSGKVFSDTNGHWAQESISRAAAYGIVNGYDETNFGPDNVIAREQMAVMISKAANLSGGEGQNFADSNQIADWAKAAVTVASSKNIISGYPDNTFRPQANATRAEAVTVIVKALN